MDIILEKYTTKFKESIRKILESIDLESIDDILDSRDSDTFSNLWMKAWQKVENINIKIDVQREQLFKFIFSKTDSSDLAAYFIEDFELIAKHLNEEEDNWVTNLCGTYFDLKIPHGELENKNIGLIELVNQ